MRYSTLIVMLFLLGITNLLAQSTTTDISNKLSYSYGDGDTVIVDGYGGGGDHITHVINYENCGIEIEYKKNNSFKVQGPNFLSTSYTSICPGHYSCPCREYGVYPCRAVVKILVKEASTYTISFEINKIREASKCNPSSSENDKYIGTIYITPKPKDYQAAHYHQLDANPIFNTRKLLATTPNNNSFKVCADGSQASIFKFSGGANNYSQATLSIPSDVSTYGSFSLISQGADSLVVHYKHPTILNPNAPFFMFTATLMIPGSQAKQFSIQVYRAPVVMIHGLWSNRTSFQALESSLLRTGLYSINFLKRADYSRFNNLRFSANKDVASAAIDDVITQLRDSQISAGNADIVAHSMGGILSRLYLQSPTYRSDIHKLITINTPHSGSQIANFLKDVVNENANDAICGPTLKGLFSNNTICDGGAVEDLRVNSIAIDSDLNGPQNLNHNKTPSHTIATVEYATSVEVIESIIKPMDRTISLKWIIDAFGSYRTGLLFFPDLENDVVVSLTSQKGGMPTNCTSYINNQIHMGSPANLQVIERVKTLLGDDPSGNSFCLGFNPVDLSYNPQSKLESISNIATTSTEISLGINSPISGSYYNSASTIPISVSSIGVSEYLTIIRYNYDSVYVAKSTASTVSYSVLAGPYTGRRQVIVIGKTSSGKSIADTSYFIVADNLCTSLQSGDWTSTSTWSCGHEPRSSDIVVMNPSHTITISTNSAQAKRIIYNGGKLLFLTGSTKVSIQEDE